MTGGLTSCSATGTSHPEVGESATESGYRQRKVAYRNLRNGRFQEVSESLGPGVVDILLMNSKHR